MRLLPLLILAPSFLLAGCYGMGGNAYERQSYEQIGVATAPLRGSSGSFNGEATITELDTGIRVVIEASGIVPGVHAVHIHERGDCSTPDFSSAGSHWNPTRRGHGRNNPAGQHMGDMPNLIIGADGTGLIELTVNGASIGGGRRRPALLDEDGAAIVIHAGPDDYASDPAGNAGPRVACGVIHPAS